MMNPPGDLRASESNGIIYKTGLNLAQDGDACLSC